MTTTRKSVASILVAGRQDWNDLGWARQRTGDYFDAPSSAALRDETLDVLDQLLNEGLVVAGDVRRDEGFVPWPLDAAATLARIRSEWTDPDALLRPGDVCWLDNTPAGDELAEQLWQEHVREHGPNAQL